MKKHDAKILSNSDFWILNFLDAKQNNKQNVAIIFVK